MILSGCSKNADVKARLANGKVLIKENIDLFKCPVCGSKMNADDLKSITCINNHCFDISRSGYVNLLLKPPKSQYDKDLFVSRDIICNMGFFNPLLESIVTLIGKTSHNINSDNHINVLDAGCGEGFHLSQVVKSLRKKWGNKFQGVGIDISKDGIQIASKRFKNVIWCVADLVKIPFMDNKFNVILNILSPSNYSEFNRLLSRNGMLIKIVPGSRYLEELRNVFYKGTDKRRYSNNKVIERFSENFNLIDTNKILYNVAVDKEQLGHLIKMTPLSWNVPNEIIQKAFDQGINSVTADFTIMAGTPLPFP